MQDKVPDRYRADSAQGLRLADPCLRSLHLGDPRAHPRTNRIVHARPLSRHGGEVWRRCSVRVRFAVYLVNQRAQPLGHAGPSLRKFDLAHRPIVPETRLGRPKPVSEPESKKSPSEFIGYRREAVTVLDP